MTLQSLDEMIATRVIEPAHPHRWIASPLQLLIWQVLVATIVLTGSALVADGLPHAEWSWRLVLLFLYSGLIGTALAYWAMSMVNKSISALTTSLGTTGTPLVGIASAAILLGEPIDISLAVAAERAVHRAGLPSCRAGCRRLQ
jgi:drug/metabolite transporter (DMT)-like permease